MESLSLRGKEECSSNIIIPHAWSEAADFIATGKTTFTNPPSITVICGPKNAGKSTFSRYLVNTLLNSYRKVAYLDTDLGQPEFTPPGCLSLHIIDRITPDLSMPCIKTPERCFFYGDVSSKRDPVAYLNNIFDLYNYFRKEYHQSDNHEDPGKKQLPLVVNTPGWVKGIGYDILVDLLRYIGPTHVVNIRISATNKNLPSGTFWLDDDQVLQVDLINLDAARQDSLNRSVLVQKDGRLMRDLRVIAYFRQCFPSDMNIITYKELAHAFAIHPPYEVPISKIKVMHLHCQVPVSEIFFSLNATIVGLAIRPENPTESNTCKPRCVGLGIVRSIDIVRGLFYVITPVPQCNLGRVNLFLQGLIEIPTCFLQVRGTISPYMSSNVLPTN